MTTTPSERRLHRMLKQDLGQAVRRNERGTWTTTSNLPHEIRLHTQAGLELVRISAGVLIGVKATKGLLADINDMNTARAYSRRIHVDNKVLVVAELPVASLRKGVLEDVIGMVLCCARLDAPVLADRGDRPVTDPPPHLSPDLSAPLHSWWDVLRVSGTATARELAVWLGDTTGSECWIDEDGESVIVVIDGVGSGNSYPCTLADLHDSVHDLEQQALDLAEDD